MNIEKIKLMSSDFHPHLKARMLERGVTEEEVERTMEEGWEADDAKAGTTGKVFVFPYNGLGGQNFCGKRSHGVL
jgi:hypothetical protein